MPLALGVSVALHAVILYFAPGFVQERTDSMRPAALRVEITSTPEAVAAAPPETASLPDELPALAENPFAAASVAASAPEPAGSAEDGRPHGAKHDAELPAPPAVAPRYYGSREIDVFPEPVVPLRVPRPNARAGVVAAQSVRMEVFIDAQGVVTDVAVRESGDSSGTLAAARKLIFAARFHPARRSGNAVASRIEIELHEDGDPPPPAAESR